MFGEIDGIAVGVVDAVFRLAVRRSLVDAGRSIEFLTSLAHGSHILQLETKMIDTHLQLRPFDLALRPDRYDRKINVPIGKISRRADAVNDLQAERRGIKLNQLLHVLGENSEMTDASHKLSPLRSICSWPHPTKSKPHLTSLIDVRPSPAQTTRLLKTNLFTLRQPHDERPGP